MRVVLLACLAANSIACAADRLAPVAETPSEQLTYAWSAGMAAEVFVRTTRIRADGREQPQRSIETRHRIRTEPHPRGLRVVADAFEILRIDGREASGPTPFDHPAAAFLAPTLVVGGDGQVVEVEGLAALRASLAARAAGDAKSGVRAERVAELAASPERLTAHWAHAVGLWIGRTVKPGKVYAVVSRSGGESRPASIHVSEPVRCFEEDPVPRCLRLVLESSSSGREGRKETRDRVRALSSELGVADLPVDAIRSAEELETISVVTEPERLVPHSVQVRRERRIELDDGTSRTLQAIDETQHLYRW
jgi:hypothetical protein